MPPRDLLLPLPASLAGTQQAAGSRQVRQQQPEMRSAGHFRASWSQPHCDDAPAAGRVSSTDPTTKKNWPYASAFLPSPSVPEHDPGLSDQQRFISKDQRRAAFVTLTPAPSAVVFACFVGAQLRARAPGAMADQAVYRRLVAQKWTRTSRLEDLHHDYVPITCTAQNACTPLYRRVYKNECRRSPLLQPQPALPRSILSVQGVRPPRKIHAKTILPRAAAVCNVRAPYVGQVGRDKRCVQSA